MHRSASIGLIFLLLVLFAPSSQAVELGLDHDRFTLDGKPTFLLGCSYYGGLGASDTTIRSDLDELHRLGFNWVRVWADWTAHDAGLSAVDIATGEPRQPYLQALVRLCDECNRREMVVNITLTRGTVTGGRPCLRDLPAHRRAVQTLVTALKDRTNWYLDLSNERNIRDPRFTSIDDLADLRNAAKKLNPHLLITASHGGDASRKDIQSYLQAAQLDFISIHRSRDAHSVANAAEATRQYRDWIRQTRPVVPLQYDEPFRRDYGSWQPTAADFTTDLQSSRQAGAAGWCFHNGDTRSTPDRQPRRSFDLQSRTLFQQLDPEERKFLAQLQPAPQPTTLPSPSSAQTIQRDIPYAGVDDKNRTLDIYSPANPHNLPVLFWIHGGGWQAGDKSEVKSKPQAFTDKGFVFVSVNYRLLPAVDMDTLTHDVATSFRWVYDHIAEHGGDPRRVLVAGHSAGAQLAALLCTDEKYLKEQGVPFDVLKACIPVDGDTYDIPAIIELAETRWRLHGMPPQKFGHREKFGNDPAKHRDFSAVYHVAKGKHIPPFLILHVAAHPDTSAQAFRLAAVLKEAGIPARLFPAQDTNHNKLNDDLGLPTDPATQAIFDFIVQTIK